MDSAIRTVIKPRSSFEILNIKEIINFRDLIFFLVWRNVKVKYAQSVLGLAWTFIQPFMTMIVFTLVFGKVAQIPTDGIPGPIFYFSALIPWTYFSSSFTGATGSLITSQGLFTKVYFPRIIIPITPLLSKFVDFSISLLFLLGMMAYYGIMPGIEVLALPLLIIIMFLTAGGMGMLLTSLSVQYRDVQYLMSFMVRLLMYGTPIIYSINLLKEQIGVYGLPDWLIYIYGLFPMAGVIQGFRSALVGGSPMPWDLIGIGFLSSILIFLIGAYYFKSKEQIFADVV